MSDAADDSEVRIEWGSFMPPPGLRAVGVRVAAASVTSNPAIRVNAHLSVYCCTKKANGEVEQTMVVEDTVVLAVDDKARRDEQGLGDRETRDVTLARNRRTCFTSGSQARPAH
jgi:hypothetical protein